MMKKYYLATILMLFVINAYADNYTGNVNFLLGQKSLKSEDWAPVEEQTAFAVLIDFKQSKWPVSIAIDLLASSDKDTLYNVKYKGSTSELNLGVRKIWEESGTTLRPYIGGGIAFIKAEVKGTYLSGNSESASDNAIGFWLNTGLYWALTPHFNLGMDLRYSNAEVTIKNVNSDAGGGTAGLILGYHW